MTQESRILCPAPTALVSQKIPSGLDLRNGKILTDCCEGRGRLSLQEHFPVEVLYPGVQDAAVFHVHFRDGAAEIAAGAVHGAGA